MHPDKLNPRLQLPVSQSHVPQRGVLAHDLHLLDAWTSPQTGKAILAAGFVSRVRSERALQRSPLAASGARRRN
jgi:hypothetical protein